METVTITGRLNVNQRFHRKSDQRKSKLGAFSSSLGINLYAQCTSH